MKIKMILVGSFSAFLLFTHMLFAAQVSLEHFHVITVASCRGGHFECLEKSAKLHHINLEILGLGQPYPSNGEKFIQVMKYLDTLQDDEIVMFVDAFDCIIIADKKDILEKFINMNVPFLIGAEKNCAFYSHLADQYPLSPTPFRWINTGTYIGYVGFLKEWLGDMAPNAYEDDQAQATLHFFKRPDFYHFDYNCDLFFPLYLVELNTVRIDVGNKSVYNTVTNSYPYVLHANAHSFYILDKTYKLFNIERLLSRMK